LWRFLKGMLNIAFQFPLNKRSQLNKNRQALLHPCVAHRGFSGLAPENTLAAFRMAIEQPYVQELELDVHLSKDNIPVVIHDGSLKRTTNGQGLVREKTAEELGRLDAGSWFNPSFATEGVPTLKEVLTLLAGRCRVNVELKGDEVDRKQLVQRAMDVIHSLNMEQDIVITSFIPEILTAVRQYAPAMNIGLIVDEVQADLIARLAALEAGFLSVSYTQLNARLLKQTAEAGISVMAWTINAPGQLRRLARRSEPFQLCTNFPNRWHAVMTEEK
jgi:glycerophosphoryl diester phosphodiesterase